MCGAGEETAVALICALHRTCEVSGFTILRATFVVSIPFSRCTQETSHACFCAITRKSQFQNRSHAIAWEVSHRKHPGSSSPVMPGSVGNNRPRPIFSMGRYNTSCNMWPGRRRIGWLGWWHTYSFIMTARPIWTVTRSQVVGESASQLGTEKSYLADKCTGQARHDPNMSLPTSRNIIFIY